MLLLTEDDFPAMNLITEIDLEETIQTLEKLFHDNQIRISQPNAIENLRSLKKDVGFQKILETLKSTRALQNDIKNLNLELKNQDKITEITKVIPSLEKVEKILRTTEATVAMGLLIVALKPKAEDELEWLKNLSISLLELLYVLENNSEMISYKRELEVEFKKTFDFLASDEMKNLEPRNEFQKEITQKYATHIRTTTKAILWEIKNLEEKNTFSTAESLLNYIKNSPTWEGDDFEECLKFVNDLKK